MADNNTIARPYARAAFAVAKENDALEELSRSLGIAKDILADGQVTRFLADPAMTDEQRLEFLSGIFAEAAGNSWGGFTAVPGATIQPFRKG